MNKHAPHPVGIASASLAMASSLLWGGNMVALKLGLTTFAPFWSAWWRMAIGALVIAAWARSRNVRLPMPPDERRPLLTLTAMFTAQIVLLNTGADLSSPAYAVVILNSHPIFSNVVGHFVASEHRLTPIRLIGLALAFAGICYLVLGRPIETLAPRPLLGNLLLLGSALLLGIRTVYTRWIIQSIEPMRALVWQMLGSLPVFLVSAVLLEPMLLKPVTTVPILALAYQGVIIAGLCFIIWTMLLRRHAAGTLAMFAFTVPFFGILASALVFGEPVTPRIILAALLVTGGLALVGRS
ncbi:MAG: DMT family transporter [bacterium]|nr:DMT family transporter [bacterium]